MPLINMNNAEVLVDGLDHPEGVALGPDGHIYAGGEAGQVYRIDIHSRHVEHFGTTKGINLGLALDAACNVYMCNPGDRAVKKVTPSGEVTVYSKGNADRQFVAPNYPAFDHSGNLYVTDCGNWKADDGCIWSIAPDGTSTIIDTASSQFPNGCAVSPDGQFLYVAMSLNPPRVIRFGIENGLRTGTAETVVELPHCVPDGLAFCSDGSLLIACYRPDTIFRLTTNGELSILMDDYEGTLLGAPTNVCFGGADLSVLFWGNLGRWHIGMNSTTGLRGTSLFYPSL